MNTNISGGIDMVEMVRMRKYKPVKPPTME
jgi:hypothetical protein